MANRETVFSRFQDQGFIKTERPISIVLDASQKAVLNRRGNVLYNKGDIEAAKKIFLATGYSDGIVRIGDHYLHHGQQLDALKMYWIAPDKVKAAPLIERLSLLVRKIMTEEKDS